jgi:PBSX family phage terminase large subunit
MVAVAKAPFQFSDEFSDKQVKLMTWWTEESPYNECDMLIADGSIRSGKTIGMITSFLLWSQATHKNRNFILAGKSMGALKRNVVEEMEKICTTLMLSYKYIRSGEPHLVIGSNIYYLFGASNEASQDTLQGLTAAGAYLDEVALLPESFVNQAIGRCSIDDSKVFMNCNPNSPKHYIKVKFIDEAKKKKILRLHFTLDDNPSLSKKIKDKYKRMFKGVFFQRYILGQWVVAEGVVYVDYYQPDVHIVKRSVIEQMIKDKAFKDYGAGTDWGFTHPMTGLLYGITHDNQYYQIAEYYKTQQKTDDLGKWYLKWEEKLGKKIQVIFCDSAEPDRILALKEMGLNATGAPSKEILGGIESVMNAFVDDRLFISEDCTNTDNELQTYRFPSEDDSIPLQKKDLPIDDDNHAMDGMRYFVNNYDKFLFGQARKEERRNERLKRKRKAIK